MKTHTIAHRFDDQITMNDFSQYMLDEDSEIIEGVMQNEEVDLVQMLYSQAPVHIALNLLTAVAATVLFWNSLQTFLLVPWLFFITLSSALEFGLQHYFSRVHNQSESIVTWRRLYTFNASCIGLGWGIGALIMLPQLSTQQGLILGIAMLFLMLASIPMLGAIFSSYLSVMSSMLVPLAVYAYLYAGADASLYYIAITSAALLLVLLARNYTQILRNSFRLASIYSRLADAMSNEYQGAVASKNRLKGRFRDLASDRRVIKREKTHLQNSLDSIAEGIVATNENGAITFMNPVAEVLTGWTETEVKSRKIDDIFKLVSDTAEEEELQHLAEECLDTGKVICSRENTSLIRKDGLQYAVECMASPIRDQDGKRHGVIMIFRDVTERRNIVRQISWQATHDTLTRLINRREFESRLDKLVFSAHRDGYNHVLCYLDLDQFKMINDSYGHAAGDELLKKLSASLRVHVRGTDTLARLGGDEFGILLYSCSLDKARLIADGLRQLVEDFRFIWKGKTLRVGVSIGLVEIDNSWKDLTEVLNAADTACYIAKDSGRNRIHVYRLEDAENQGRNGEMQMIQNIQYALEQGSFELFQQTISPLISTKQHVKHCEVLTRMRTEAGDVINAEDYVPTAERYRLMPQIDRWVVRATIHAMHFNHPSLTDMDLVSINISAQSLSDERFLQYILELLAENNVRADRLCFEISEASYLNNQGRADVFINRLRDRGCRFALDNFGAVSSVFNTLKTIDMDYLKIDGAFVQDIVDDEMERNMVESINHMGHRIGMRTVVQHISDQKTLDVIREMGVDFAQGYCIEQPHPISDLQVMARD